jgi:predicted deacetylase
MMGAQYLVRFDDICPTMNWDVWRQVETILDESGIKPLLAVVPDNRDAQLCAGPEDPRFWIRVREWQSRCWTIAMHGFQHRYVTSSAGIIGRNRYSEFAGLDESVQLSKLRNAAAIFEREQVRTDAWIAPAHSFDQATVRSLRKIGIDCISDGYSLFPYVCREELLWIPQQIARFRSMPFGTWTVCLHINGWKQQDIDRFRRDVTRFRSSITNVGGIRRQYRTRSQSVSDQLFFNCFRTIRSLKAGV